MMQIISLLNLNQVLNLVIVETAYESQSLGDQSDLIIERKI